MSTQDIPTPKDAINEYFKLKSKFENELSVNKKKIMNNPNLSKREKRSEFLKLMPKCVNCKKPSKMGTIFSVVYNPDTDSVGAYRRFTVTCGNLVDPCNLDIDIHLGESEPLEKLIHKIREEIKLYKNKIIDDKNRLLFGLITTETALENFDLNKNYINDLTSVYEMYLDQWNIMIDNPDKKVELDESLTLAYENIIKIKDCIKKMNQNDDVQFAVDAADIYATTLKPLLDKIRHLKYSDNIVYHDDYDNKCKLIQRLYTDLDMMVTGYTDKVIKYNLGFEIKKTKKIKPEQLNLNVDDESEEFLIQPKNNTIQNKNVLRTGGTTLKDVPIIEKVSDDFDSNIPSAFKNEFKTNINQNLILPPKQMNNGQYDFGVAIYNEVFNAQPKSVQDAYLTYYKVDPSTKEKNYNQLEYELNKLVEVEVSRGRS